MNEAESLMRLAAPKVEYGLTEEAALALIVGSAQKEPCNPGMTRNRSRLKAVLVVAAVLVAIVAIGASFRPTPAVAALTPPLLIAHPAEGTVSELFRGFAALRSQHPDTISGIETHAWNLNTEITEDGTVSSANIEPTQKITVFRPDGSEDTTLVSDHPFPGQETDDIQAPGTILAQTHQASGETFKDLLPGPLPATAREMGPWLGRVFDDDPFAGVPELVNLLTGVPVTAPQEAAVLEFIAGAPGVTLLGKVSDRLGRPGVAFRVSQTEDHEQILLVSPASGAIIAFETIYTGDSRTDIEAPAVTSYVAWTRS